MKKQLEFVMKYQKKNHNKTNQTKMFKKIVLLLAVFFSFTVINAQEIEKKWQLSSSESDYLELQKKV